MPTFIPRTTEQQGLLVRVAKAALASPDALYMRDWHKCPTTHCIAGWALHLTGRPWDVEAPGYDVWESQEATKLLGHEAYDRFWDTDTDARQWLVGVLRDAGEAVPEWITAQEVSK